MLDGALCEDFLSPLDAGNEVIERQTSFNAWLERCNCTGETAEKTRELLSHRLSGDNYTSTVFLIKGVKKS